MAIPDVTGSYQIALHELDKAEKELDALNEQVKKDLDHVTQRLKVIRESKAPPAQLELPLEDEEKENE